MSLVANSTGPTEPSWLPFLSLSESQSEWTCQWRFPQLFQNCGWAQILKCGTKNVKREKSCGIHYFSAEGVSSQTLNSRKSFSIPLCEFRTPKDLVEISKFIGVRGKRERADSDFSECSTVKMAERRWSLIDFVWMKEKETEDFFIYILRFLSILKF